MVLSRIQKLDMHVFVGWKGQLNGREGFFPKQFVQRRPVSRAQNSPFVIL